MKNLAVAKTIFFRPKFPIIILILIMLSVGIKISYESFCEYRKINHFVYFCEKVSDFVKNETITENSKTTESEFDSSQYFQFYTKEQLTELKKICFWRSRSDGKQGYEHHAIDRAVGKWKGIPYQELMETFRKENLCTDKDGEWFFVATKWSAPALKQDGIFKPATILRTTNKHLKLKENFKNAK